ncbi:MAG: hypothetical protein M0P39_03545 [Rhodocyclaceae bacterium]|nr:hypothetical protein [Rhodocyclaceae bacterium]
MDSDEERDLIRKADAFMQRLRPPADEDVPVLTEVVEANALRPPLSDDVREVLVTELENWLDMHLPAAVLRVLDGVADQLIAQIAQDARKDLLPQLLSVLENRRHGSP